MVLVKEMPFTGKEKVLNDINISENEILALLLSFPYLIIIFCCRHSEWKEKMRPLLQKNSRAEIFSYFI